MSRIDVTKSNKKFKVMINFGGIACFEYSTAALANSEAKKLKATQYPHASLNLLVEA